MHDPAMVTRRLLVSVVTCLVVFSCVPPGAGQQRPGVVKKYSREERETMRRRLEAQRAALQEERDASAQVANDSQSEQDDLDRRAAQWAEAIAQQQRDAASAPPSGRIAFGGGDEIIPPPPSSPSLGADDGAGGPAQRRRRILSSDEDDDGPSRWTGTPRRRPVLTPPTGTFITSIGVSLTATDADSLRGDDWIHYTTDGSQPTRASPAVWTGGLVHVGEPTVLIRAFVRGERDDGEDDSGEGFGMFDVAYGEENVCIGATGICTAVDGRTGIGYLVPYYHGRQACGNTSLSEAWVKAEVHQDPSCPESYNITDYYGNELLSIDLVTEPYNKVGRDCSTAVDRVVGGWVGG